MILVQPSVFSQPFIDSSSGSEVPIASHLPEQSGGEENRSPLRLQEKIGGAALIASRTPQPIAPPAPFGIDQAHWSEWLASGVSPEIITANVRSYSGQTALEVVTEVAVAKVQRIESYVTEPAKKILKRNENVLEGGWWVSGLDPLNGWGRMDWGQFKPNTPRLDIEKNKPIKYQTPEGTEARAIFLEIPSNPDYWAKVVADTAIVVYICEGAKKAGFLLSLGYAAIAIPGIWMGGRWRDKQGKLSNPYLIPELAAFAQAGRKFVFVPDQDEKPKTQRDVSAAVKQTGKLMKALGCDVLKTAWDTSDGKGIDDVGTSRVHAILAAAAPLAESSWQGFGVAEGGKGASPHPSTREWAIAKRRLNFLQVLPLLEQDYKIAREEDAGEEICYYEGRTPEFSKALIEGISTIVVRGFLAAGKTHAAIESIAQAISATAAIRQVIWISGRNGLLRQTEGRLQSRLQELAEVCHFQDDVRLHGDLLRSGQPGVYCLCDASLSDYHARNIDWSKALVIIDEFSSVRSDVVSKPKILPQFQEMLSKARQLIVLDAFVSAIDCRILTKHRGGDRLILDQLPEKALKKIQWVAALTGAGEISLSHDGVAFSVLDRWFAEPFAKNDTERRYIVVVDSLLTARAIEYYVRHELGLQQEDILLCSSDTPEESRRLLANPNERIRESGAKLVILTPTAESGVDIQVSFTEGLGLFCGVLSGTRALQLVGRARQCNDWTISAPRRSIDSDARMTDRKLERGLERLGEAYEAAGVAGDNRLDGWAVWQREIRQPQSAFNSEFIHHLLMEHYESVETIQLPIASVKWKELVKDIGESKAVRTLVANLDRGQALLKEEKQPSTDQEVYDLALATGYEQYPQLWQAAIEGYHMGGEAQEDSIKLGRELLRKGGLDKLKRYVQAIDCSLDDDNMLNERVARAGVNYASPAFKQLQYQNLFRQLKLEALAKMGRGSKVKAELVDAAAYDARSPQIEVRWKQFQKSTRLKNLFPLVEDMSDFWAQVKRCMVFFGFKSEGGTARALRDGKKPSRYYVGWVIRSESGSSLFVEKFDIFIQAARDRLEANRLEHKSRASHAVVPPPEKTAA
jgi:hypothetical protein